MSDTATTETPALPGDGLRESIVDDLRRHIGDGLVEHVLKPQDDLWIRIAADRWADAGRALRAIGFEYFCFLSAIDWKPSPFGRGEDDPTQPPPERKTAVVQGFAGGETRFQVLARVTDIKRHVGVTLKSDVADDDLSIDSWHAIYAGANWHERETHEMFGISFNGHPDLRNMYLPTEFEGHPLRKDFPLLARIVKPWPGIVDVEPMPADDDDGGGVADAAPAADTPAAEGEAATTAAPAGDESTAPSEDTAEAAPETAADAATVTDETVEDAPAHEIPADAAAAEAAEAEPDTVVADETAADVAPVAEEAAADVPAEPEGEVGTVAGTADEVEAVADAVADETREADENVPEAPAEVADVAEAADADGAGSAVPASEDSDGAEAPSSAEITDPSQIADQSDADPVAPAASPVPAAEPANPEPGPYAGSLVASDDGAMPAGFEIKGNGHSMLFHVPGSRYYNATKAEYWFDTEENARAAGFKKPGEKHHD